jgi:tetratricopeptide (TPR) repeat protein
VGEQGQKAETKTDAKGNYEFHNLRSGIYTVNVIIPNQAPFILQVRVTGGQQAEANVNFKDVVAKAGAEAQEQMKKQAEEKQKFAGMKQHFDAGTQLLDQVRLAKAAVSKLPATATPEEKDAAKKNLSEVADKAANEFSEAQKAAGEKDPNQHLLWAKLGESYDLGGRTDEAINAYQQAVKAFEPLLADKEKAGIGAGYYNNLGNVLARGGKVEDARAAYLKSIELNPASAAQAWRNFGVVLYNANRLPESVEPLKKAVELDAKSAQAWYLLGAALVATAEFKTEAGVMKMIVRPGTEEAYQKALELDPNGPFGVQAKQGLEMLAQLTGGVQTKIGTPSKKKKN